MCGSFASASRNASVRWAVSSVTRRSESGWMSSSSSGASGVGAAGAPPTVMTARCTAPSGAGDRRLAVAFGLAPATGSTGASSSGRT